MTDDDIILELLKRYRDSLVSGEKTSLHWEVGKDGTRIFLDNGEERYWVTKSQLEDHPEISKEDRLAGKIWNWLHH